MSTTNHESTEKRVKQGRPPDVQTGDAKKTVEGSGSVREQNKEEQRKTTAKQDKERSDWEGMTPKPEQGEDDIAAPGQLPETD